MKFTLSLKEWNKFVGHLNEPPKQIPQLKKLFKKPCNIFGKDGIVLDGITNSITVPNEEKFVLGKDNFTIDFRVRFPQRKWQLFTMVRSSEGTSYYLDGQIMINEFMTNRFLRRQ